MGRFNILTSLFGFHAGTSRQAWSSSCALIEKATNQEDARRAYQARGVGGQRRSRCGL